MDNPLDTTLGARMAAYLNSGEDYRKQRMRVNKQLMRLRRELGLVVRDTKNYSKKDRVRDISAAQYAENNKYGLLLLMTAERDFLYALELKHLLEMSDRRGSYQTLMISKIRRGLQRVRKLLELVPADADVQRLQLYVYAAVAEGHEAVARRQWKRAVAALSVAKCSVDYLVSRDDSDHQLLYEVGETQLDPALALALSKDGSTRSDLKAASRKHCHDEQGYLKGAVAIVERLDPAYVEDLAQSVDLIKSVTWRGHDAVIYSEEVAYKIMGLQQPRELEASTDFDVVIAGWNDVYELHREDTARNQDADDSDNVQNRAILMTFIRYNLLFTKLKRDTLLVDELLAAGKLKDAHRVYAQAVAAAQELQDLPGVYNDDDLHTSLVGLAAYYQARHSEVVGDCFRQAHRYPEALKVYASVASSVDADAPYSVEFPYDLTSNAEYARYAQHVHTKLVQCQVTAQLSHGTVGGGYVADHVNTFPDTVSGDRIVNLPQEPRMVPVLSKPVLFDVAFNYISMNGGQQPAAVAAEPEAEPVAEPEDKKKGLFGFFGRK
ncbi:signal recognition particle subunit Srp68p [Diutina catenulata]